MIRRDRHKHLFLAHSARSRPGFLPLLVAAGLVLLSSGCEIVGASGDGEAVRPNTVIQYVAAGGIGGGILQKLSISEEGLVTNELTTPHLQLQLSKQEYQQLLALFTGFNALDNEYEGQICADDIVYTITYRQKTVSASGCTLRDAQRGNLARVAQIVETLSGLAQRVYEEQAPWRGLEADFYVEATTVGLGEPVKLVYCIVNPTDEARTLYFPYEERLAFRVYREGFPAFSYSYVPDPHERELSTLDVPPGGEQTLTLAWDQTLTDRDGHRITLEVGRYWLALRLLDTSFLRNDTGIPIDVVDRNVPLAGYVMGRGEDRSVPDYTFELHVRNWMEVPVTLDFPYRQRLYVELYDLDKPDPDPRLLYGGPQERQQDPSSLTLQPDETHVFEYTVPKEELNLTYMWYLARVELLASNVDFTRESQLRIFHND